MYHRHRGASALRLLAPFAVILIAASHQAIAQTPAAPHPPRPTFDSSDVMIPMRDGVKLHTTIFVPKGVSTDLPFLLTRSLPGEAQWTPASTKNVQLGINFGLLQLGLGGFNVAGELRYERLWLEYSHGMELTLNKLGGFGLTEAERDQNLHIRVPFTTGFGVGVTLVNELWLGAEFKAHGYDVNAPGGRVSSYHTYSIGPVLGYKYYIWKGLFADAYGRYWPNVATSLDGGKIALTGTSGTVEHTAHDFGLFANVSVGYMFRK